MGIIAKSKKRLQFKIERLIPASPGEVYDGWLDPNVPGTVWNAAETFILDAQVDGLFYWYLKKNAHFGRFTKMKYPNQIQYTWMSPSTRGEESLVTVSFKKKGKATLMTLVHSDLPDFPMAKGHDKGWNYFMAVFTEQFGDGSRKKYDWREAHPRKKNKAR